jgi:uncharacterized LabA/DUF88 family protein
VAWCAASLGRPQLFRGKFVSVYVDGFNLYHRALRNTRAPDGSTYKWLDLEKLAAHVLSNPDYAIGRIRYFTARVRALPSDPQAPLRQQMYLRALATLSSVTVHFGFFQKSQKKMQLVKPLPDGTTMVKVHKFEEKGSDVNLATYLLFDAFQNEYDGAAVITNDSDLAEPIRIVRDTLAKRVEVLDPCSDGRTSAELAKVATFYKPIRLGAISASLFPDSLTDVHGTFRKPAPW